MMKFFLIAVLALVVIKIIYALCSLDDKDGKDYFWDLLSAVRKDDVKTAYTLLQRGINDINRGIYIDYPEYCEETGSSSELTIRECMDYSCTYADPTCLFNCACSQQMKRLLSHFGALPKHELQPIWKKRGEEQKRKRLLEEEKRKKDLEDRKIQQEADDKAFLDRVL